MQAQNKEIFQFHVNERTLIHNYCGTIINSMYEYCDSHKIQMSFIIRLKLIKDTFLTKFNFNRNTEGSERYQEVQVLMTTIKLMRLIYTYILT